MVPQTGCKQSLELFSHGLCAAARFSISGPRYNFYIVSSSPMARGNYLVTFCFLWFLNLQVFQVSWKEQYQLAQSIFEDQFSPSRKNAGSWVGITLHVSAHGSCCGWLWKALGLYWVDHCSCCTSMRGKCSSLLEWECSLLSTCRTWLEVPLGQASSTNSQLNSKYRSKKVFLA